MSELIQDVKQRFDAKRPAIQRRAKELNVRGYWDGARDFLQGLVKNAGAALPSIGQWVAPTLDLNVAFHRHAGDHDWLLCDGAAPVSTEGLFGWTARVWSTDGRLHASGGGQCLYRRMQPPPG